ncbi:MAG TPA: CaiB/BaiF CoA-transferase family protein [Pseudolabrys sp.]|nr:CaiB/BaiF CoA-transferase family protein [Pseudolabrys sp.]
MRPLEGVTVLDFSTLLPGPMATLLLAEAGAEVIKVERPGTGEEMRHYRPSWGRDSVNFALLNRGKKSLALDLKNAADRSVLDPLIARADVLVEQFRPGVMARLGLDYQTLSVSNPRLVYCSITGYGQTGPKRNVAGHDLNYIGDAGLLALSMGDPERPVVPPALIADIAGGAYPAVMNIMMALAQRQRTGRGCYLDIAMADNLFPFMYWAMGEGLGQGQWPGSGTGLVCGGTPRYRLYETADSKAVAAAPIEQKFWNEFCELIGLDHDLRDDTRDMQATTRRIVDIIRSKPAEHWRACFSGRDCCCTIVVSLKEAMDDPHFRARGLFDHMLENESGQCMPALPVPIAAAFRGTPDIPVAAPQLGGHNSELKI